MNIESNITRVADQAERYEDMVQFLKEILQETSEDVSMDVNNLLSVGLKNLILSQKILEHVQKVKAYTFLLLWSSKRKIV